MWYDVVINRLIPLDWTGALLAVARFSPENRLFFQVREGAFGILGNQMSFQSVNHESGKEVLPTTYPVRTVGGRAGILAVFLPRYVKLPVLIGLPALIVKLEELLKSDRKGTLPSSRVIVPNVPARLDANAVEKLSRNHRHCRTA